jgi:uncharacterized protein with GYD domain
MPLFMAQFSYTPEAWAALSRKPEDRAEAFGALTSKMGGKMHSLHYCFGEYDGVIMLEAPDESTVLSILIAAIAPGHVKATKTTTLFTPQQAVAAMRKAGTASYRAPGG